MQDIWQMMQHIKCGQKGQLALRFKICFAWNLEEMRQQENVYGRTDVLMYWRTHALMPDFPPVR